MGYSTEKLSLLEKGKELKRVAKQEASIAKKRLKSEIEDMGAFARGELKPELKQAKLNVEYKKLMYETGHLVENFKLKEFMRLKGDALKEKINTEYKKIQAT